MNNGILTSLLMNNLVSMESDNLAVAAIFVYLTPAEDLQDVISSFFPSQIKPREKWAVPAVLELSPADNG